MNRTVLILCVLVVGAAMAWMAMRDTSTVSVTHATLSPMKDGTFMGSVTLANDGVADRLLSVSSVDFVHAHLMGADGATVIPANATPSLAGDGLHLMMGEGEAPLGSLIPIELRFAKAGAVPLRAKVVDTMMSHETDTGVEVEGVQLTLRPPTAASKDGFRVGLDIKGIELKSVPDGTAHVAGEGHAHVYLNGLKLQRLYQTDFEIGGLLPGAYTLRVSLNAHDHRPMLSGGRPLDAVWQFTLD